MLGSFVVVPGHAESPHTRVPDKVAQASSRFLPQLTSEMSILSTRCHIVCISVLFVGDFTVEFHYWAPLVVQTVKTLPATQETQVRFLGREDSPGEDNGNPFQCSCLDNPMDRGAWWATVHGVTKSWTRLCDQHSMLTVAPGTGLQGCQNTGWLAVWCWYRENGGWVRLQHYWSWSV